MLPHVEEDRAAESMDRLLRRMSFIRHALHQALQKANGNHQDEAVQRLSGQFDRLLNQYMQVQLQEKAK